MTDTAYHKIRSEIPPPPSGCPVDHTFSPFADDYLADPYAVLAPRREDTPVFYAAELGYVVVTRMEHVEEVFLNPDVYSSENVQDPVFPVHPAAAEVLAADDFDPVAVMSNRQEPDHGRIRKYTKEGFSNRRLRLLEPYITRRAHQLIDAMVDAGPPAAFVEAFAFPLPGETIFRFLGFPEDDDEKLRAWCGDRLAFSWGKPTEDEQVEIATKMLAYWRYCRDFVAAKHRDPGDDFTSELLAAHDANPDDLTYREVESIVYGLSFAGHEPVTLLLGNCMLELLARREVWDALCADPDLIPRAIEEVIRHESPQIGWRRVTTRDTVLGGVEIPAGTLVFLSLGAANHQPDLFPEPERFDLHRPNARNNISFGKGIHYCLGAKMARFEARLVLEALTERLPSLRLVDDQVIERYPNISFRGPREVLVTWDT